MKIEKEYYENGELFCKKKIINKRIEYHYYLKNGKLYESFQTLEGELDGDRCYYHNSKIKCIAPYKKGKIHGMFKNYFDNGTIRKQVFFYNDTKSGIETCYYDNGKCHKMTSYIKDKKNGIFQIYNRQGCINESYFYINDILNGDFYKYKDNIVEMGTYINGKKEGKYIINNDYELTKCEIDYINGKKEGKCICYYTDTNKVKTLLHFKNDKKHGKHFEYDRDGKLSIENQYFEGKLNGLCYKYSNCGKIRQYSYLDDKLHGNILSFYENNKIKLSLCYQFGKKEGLCCKYYNNSAICCKSFYKNNKRHGIFQEFYPNERIKIETKYKDDKLDGNYKEYCEDGKIIKECNYNNGVLVGKYREYNIYQKIIVDMIYDNHTMYGKSYNDNKITLYKNNKKVCLLLKIDDIRKCCVCYNNTNTILRCNHFICEFCIDKLIDSTLKKNCPLCREFLIKDENNND